MEAWLARLRGLAVHCEFGLALETVLRDRFILGLHDGPERNKLFEQDSQTLTVTRALEIAQQTACVRKARSAVGASDAVGGTGAAQASIKTEPVFRMQGRAGGSHARAGFSRASASTAAARPAHRHNGDHRGDISCEVCGLKSHSAEFCRFKSYKCQSCGQKGHLRKVCKEKRKSQVYNIAEAEAVDSDSDCEECKLFNMSSTTMFTVLAPNSLEQHSLLDPPSIEYSAGTVQRACLVWTRLGQQNRFTDVCGYFHRLEALEETIPSEQRAFSRGLEYSLLSSPPPTSSYLQANYPSLYPDLTSLAQQHDEMKRLNELKLMLTASMKRNEKTNGSRQVQSGYAVNQSNLRSGTSLVQDLASGVVDSQVITGPVNGVAFINQVTTHNVGYTQGKTQNINQGTVGLATQNGTTREDIVATSKIIRSYCMTNQTTLRQFLLEFKEYATIHGVNPTVSNVAFYIKHKTVLKERELEANMTGNELRTLFIPSPVDSIKGKTKSDEEIFRGIITHKKPEVGNSVDVKNTNRSRFAKECQTSKIKPVSDIDEILEQISQMCCYTVFNDELTGLKSDLERRSINTKNRIDSEKSLDLESKELPNVSSHGDTANTSRSKSQDSSVNIVTVPIIEKDENAEDNYKQTEKSKKRSVFGLKIVNLRGKSRKGAKHDSSRRSSLKDKISKIKSVTSISNESSESFNLIDFESSFENCSNFSEDFDKMQNNRCSTSSR